MTTLHLERLVSERVDRRRANVSSSEVTTARSASRGDSTPSWVAPVFACAAILLVPWVGLLIVTLPSSHRAAHWDIAWAGFDIALALLLLAVAVAAWRCSPWLEGAASATAALLFVDAWFDVLTSSSQTELVVALPEAALIELPVAALCVWLARRSERRFRALTRTS